MIRFILKLLTLFLITIHLYACGGVVQTVKETYARENAHSAYDREDYPAAFANYTKAAELGNAEAQYNLSFMYLEGKGAAQDPQKAVMWMQKASSGGFAPAQVQMGLKHLAGAGVAKDPVKAHALFEKAAQSENPEGQYFLAVMTATDQGTPQDTAAALGWFRLAQSNGFPVPDDLLTSQGIASLGLVTQPPAGVTLPDGKALIMKIQAGLTRLGYKPGPVDGVFGKKTASAIKSFQSKAGLVMDGKASLDVLKKIDAQK